MLVYEKKVNNEWKMFGTLANVPSSSDDEVSYIDKNGQVIELAAHDTYLDDGHGAFIRKSDNRNLSMVVDDTYIIPYNKKDPPPSAGRIYNKKVKILPDEVLIVESHTLKLDSAIDTLDIEHHKLYI